LARRSIFLWFLYETYRVRLPSKANGRRTSRVRSTKIHAASLKRMETSDEFAHAYRYTLERQSVRARAVERRLVEQFRDWRFEEYGETFDSFMIPTGVGTPPILCDAYDEKSRMLVEAKAGVSRPMIRMALGQLLDYGACVTRELGSRPRLRLLVPRRPPADLEKLVRANHVGVLWRNGKRIEELLPFRWSPAAAQQ
jgi:hypothetical protein